MKKIMVIMGCVCALTGIAQQQQIGNVFSNVGLSNQSYIQRQSNSVVLATNKGNINNQQKTVRNNQVSRRVPVQQNVSRNMNPQVQPLVLNDDVQQEQMQMNINDNNVGNDINFIQQIAAVEMPAIQTGNGSLEMNVNLNINMPKINLSVNKRTVKLRAESNSSRHKLFQLEKKFKKMNRSFSGKIKYSKRLKIKVDNCFKW